MHCSGDVIPRIDLTKWYNEQPPATVPSIEIRNAIHRAGLDLTQLQSQERSLWKASKCKPFYRL